MLSADLPSVLCPRGKEVRTTAAGPELASHIMALLSARHACSPAAVHTDREANADVSVPARESASSLELACSTLTSALALYDISLAVRSPHFYDCAMKISFWSTSSLSHGLFPKALLVNIGLV